MNISQIYDQIGIDYASLRKPDERWAAIDYSNIATEFHRKSHVVISESQDSRRGHENQRSNKRGCRADGCSL